MARADQDEAVATFDLHLRGEQAVRSAVVLWLGRLGVDEDAADAAFAALGDWHSAIRRASS